MACPRRSTPQRCCRQGCRWRQTYCLRLFFIRVSVMLSSWSVRALRITSNHHPRLAGQHLSPFKHCPPTPDAPNASCRILQRGLNPRSLRQWCLPGWVTPSSMSELHGPRMTGSTQPCGRTGEWLKYFNCGQKLLANLMALDQNRNF